MRHGRLGVGFGGATGVLADLGLVALLAVALAAALLVGAAAWEAARRRLGARGSDGGGDAPRWEV